MKKLRWGATLLALSLLYGCNPAAETTDEADNNEPQIEPTGVALNWDEGNWNEADWQ